MKLNFIAISILIGCSACTNTKAISLASNTKPEEYLESKKRLSPLFKMKNSSASGVVVENDKAYVVWDDQNYLSIYDIKTQSLLSDIELIDIKLSADYTERKKNKPDFECIAKLPSNSNELNLVVLGSGSSPARENSVLLNLDTNSKVRQKNIINMNKIYQKIRKRVKQLNIEGCVWFNDKLLISNRDVTGKNTLIFEIPIDVQNLIYKKKPKLSKEEQNQIITHQINMPDKGKWRASISDLTLINGEVAFLATVEEVADSTKDGVIGASYLGKLDSSWNVTKFTQIFTKIKAEGIYYSEEKNGHYLVNDDDSPLEKSGFYFLPLK